jgi:quercetin dioxygenase-like cupin family protein
MSDHPVEVQKIEKSTKVTEDGATLVMEEEECTRIYFWTDRIIFSVSTILPGQKTPMDPGHSGAHEVVYCIQGNVAVSLPDENRYESLKEGEALCLSEGARHQVINVGTDIARLSWSLAPHIGR